jgi:F420H(2)-dependent quinone reductase
VKVQIEGDVFIAAPPVQVFDLVADERNEPRYNSRIVHAEKITDGPVGVGTRFTALTAGSARASAMTVEITDYLRPVRVASLIRSPLMRVEGALTLSPEGAGTRLRWCWTMRLRGAARLATPLMRLVGPSWERRNWLDLKRFVEGTPAAASARSRFEHAVDRRATGFGVWLVRRTQGRVVRLWRRKALVLTTTGRRTGRARSVLLQYFPDGEDLVVVAANGGMPALPAWYLNLVANPDAVAEVDGRTLRVHADELSAGEAESFWPRVLDAAPDYARYPRRTSRRLPLVRLHAVDRGALPGGERPEPVLETAG